MLKIQHVWVVMPEFSTVKGILYEKRRRVGGLFRQYPKKVTKKTCRRPGASILLTGCLKNSSPTPALVFLREFRYNDRFRSRFPEIYDIGVYSGGYCVFILLCSNTVRGFAINFWARRLFRRLVGVRHDFGHRNNGDDTVVPAMKESRSVRGGVPTTSTIWGQCRKNCRPHPSKSVLKFPGRNVMLYSTQTKDAANKKHGGF